MLQERRHKCRYPENYYVRYVSICHYRREVRWVAINLLNPLYWLLRMFIMDVLDVLWMCLLRSVYYNMTIIDALTVICKAKCYSFMLRYKKIPIFFAFQVKCSIFSSINFLAGSRYILITNITILYSLQCFSISVFDKTQ